jgi:hypothetical protein
VKTLLILAGGVAAALLAGCADDTYGYRADAYGYGPTTVVEYDGYYDGYYGPIYDGYWNGGWFWFRDRDGGRWRRDEGRHFRHDSRQGFNRIHGRTAPARPDRNRPESERNRPN